MPAAAARTPLARAQVLCSCKQHAADFDDQCQVPRLTNRGLTRRSQSRTHRPSVRLSVSHRMRCAGPSVVRATWRAASPGGRTHQQTGDEYDGSRTFFARLFWLFPDQSWPGWPPRTRRRMDWWTAVRCVVPNQVKLGGCWCHDTLPLAGCPPPVCALASCTNLQCIYLVPVALATVCNSYNHNYYSLLPHQPPGRKRLPALHTVIRPTLPPRRRVRLVSRLSLLSLVGAACCRGRRCASPLLSSSCGW